MRVVSVIAPFITTYLGSAIVAALTQRGPMTVEELIPVLLGDVDDAHADMARTKVAADVDAVCSVGMVTQLNRGRYAVLAVNDPSLSVMVDPRLGARRARLARALRPTRVNVAAVTVWSAVLAATAFAVAVGWSLVAALIGVVFYATAAAVALRWALPVTLTAQHDRGVGAASMFTHLAHVGETPGAAQAAWDAASALATVTHFDRGRLAGLVEVAHDAARTESARAAGVSDTASRLAAELFTDAATTAAVVAAATGDDADAVERWLLSGAGTIDRTRCHRCATTEVLSPPMLVSG